MIRQFLDIGIYLSQHTLVCFIVFLAILYAGFRWLRFDDRFTGWTRTWARPVLMGTTALLLVVYVVISGWYLRLEGFAGEVEPLVSSISWMVQDGHALYHDLDDSARYSILYGPSVFLTNGLFLKILGPSLFATKLASALAGLASLLLIYASVQRRKLDPAAVAVVGLAILYYWSQGFAVYLVRPDSLLLFSVSLGLFVAVRARRIFAVLGLGLILGFAVNLKVHSGFYFLPVLAIMMSRFGRRVLGGTISLAVVSVLAPFAFYDQVSLTNYLVWLGNATHHGLCWNTVLQTLRYTGGLVIPVVGLIMLQESPRAWFRDHKALVITSAVSLMVILVLAAKPGAGLVHLLPLVPTILYLVGILLQGMPRDFWLDRSDLGKAPRWGRMGLTAMLLTVILGGTVHEYRMTSLVSWQNQEASDLARDLADIQASLPGLKIGMAVGGENQNFRHTWMRPLLVFNDNPLLLDPIAVMDCHLAGRPLPPETFEAITRGDVSAWLVPKAQQPFQKLNWYPPHDPVFSTDFMEHFRAHYTPRIQSQFFDVWIWNGLSGEALGEPALAVSIR
jgi:hypothetical protein